MSCFVLLVRRIGVCQRGSVGCRASRGLVSWRVVAGDVDVEVERVERIARGLRGGLPSLILRFEHGPDGGVEVGAADGEVVRRARRAVVRAEGVDVLLFVWYQHV